MDYKIVLMQNAENDLDSFISYLLFEKRSKQAAGNLLNDFEATKVILSNVAGRGCYMSGRCFWNKNLKVNKV